MIKAKNCGDDWPEVHCKGVGSLVHTWWMKQMFWEEEQRQWQQRDRKNTSELQTRPVLDREKVGSIPFLAASLASLSAR